MLNLGNVVACARISAGFGCMVHSSVDRLDRSYPLAMI